MSEEKNNLQLTKNALGDLEKTLNDLATKLLEKKADCEKTLKEKDQQIAKLKDTTKQAVDDIEKMITKLEKVFEKDGTSNNNN